MGQHAALGTLNRHGPLLFTLLTEGDQEGLLIRGEADRSQACFLPLAAGDQFVEQPFEPLLQLARCILIGDLHLDARSQLGAALRQGFAVDH